VASEIDDRGSETEPADADQIEQDWNRALDSAGEAVSASSRANALPAKSLSTERDLIQGERKWLGGFRAALRRLFPPRSNDR
jgi:hypothetical protein